MLPIDATIFEIYLDFSAKEYEKKSTPENKARLAKARLYSEYSGFYYGTFGNLSNALYDTSYDSIPEIVNELESLKVLDNKTKEAVKRLYNIKSDDISKALSKESVTTEANAVQPGDIKVTLGGEEKLSRRKKREMKPYIQEFVPEIEKEGEEFQMYLKDERARILKDAFKV